LSLTAISVDKVGDSRHHRATWAWAMGGMQPEGPKASPAGCYPGARLEPHGQRGVRPGGGRATGEAKESRMRNGVRYSDGEAS
jgi:hypothetical protein